jgi:hypothetical protein
LVAVASPLRLLQLPLPPLPQAGLREPFTEITARRLLQWDEAAPTRFTESVGWNGSKVAEVWAEKSGYASDKLGKNVDRIKCSPIGSTVNPKLQHHAPKWFSEQLSNEKQVCCRSALTLQL